MRTPTDLSYSLVSLLLFERRERERKTKHRWHNRDRLWRNKTINVCWLKHERNNWFLNGNKEVSLERKKNLIYSQYERISSTTNSLHTVRAQDEWEKKEKKIFFSSHFDFVDRRTHTHRQTGRQTDSWLCVIIGLSNAFSLLPLYPHDRSTTNE